MHFQYGPNRYRFHPGDKLLFLVASLCLLMFICSAAICFDFDFSYDHDTPGIMSQTPIFIDDTHLKVTLIKFVNQSIILFSVDKFNFFNKDPPA
jgi:hypothetical protein